jgi:hypothetical protein
MALWPAGGGAIADALTGVINLSGKLSETFREHTRYAHIPLIFRRETGRPIMARAFSSIPLLRHKKY